jgi:hypothetical protein
MKKGIITFIILVAVSACMFTVDTHNGPLQKEKRTAKDFEGIRAGGVFEVALTQSDTYSITVETGSRLLPKIKTEVKNGVLVLSTTGDINTDSSIRVNISMPVLKSIEGSGASRIYCMSRFHSPDLRIKSSGADNISMEVESKNLQVTLSGAGSITLNGSCEKLEADLSGAGNLEAHNLETIATEVYVSGAGSASVNAQKSLSGKVNGAGNITYSGDPSDKFIETNGVGSVKHSK